MDKLDNREAEGLPEVLKPNKQKWAGFLLKHKKFQQVFCKFTDEVSILLNDELRTNTQLVTDYIHVPRSN